MEPDPIEDDGGVFDDPDGDDDGDDGEELDPREAARDRRRDHDSEAHARDLMRPGMGKVFKQVTDSWSKGPSRPPKKASRHR
jgi:hypothetical protein